MTTTEKYIEGGCACSFIRYQLTDKPLIVHCCHCTWCQRETGSAFVINAVFPASDVQHLGGKEPITVNTPSLSGRGQVIARCPECYVAVWSNYSGGGSATRFVRVGTLDAQHGIEPDVHIYTGTKVPWVVIPEGVDRCEEFYDVAKVWGRETDERRYEMLQKIRRDRVGAAEGPHAADH